MATQSADSQIDRFTLTEKISPVGKTFRITKAVSFEAAHFIASQPDGHPYRNIHGHSFMLEATLSGEVEEGREWVRDFSDFSATLSGVAGQLDHRLLNEVPGLETPTLERLCVWVAEMLHPVLPGLEEITISRPSLNERCTLHLKGR